MFQQHARCRDCNAWFFYDRPYSNGRIRQVCDRCKKGHMKAKNRRNVAAFRKRQRERENKQPENEREQGGPARFPLGGLYSDLPEPLRSATRRKVGLPA